MDRQTLFSLYAIHPTIMSRTAKNHLDGTQLAVNQHLMKNDILH